MQERIIKVGILCVLLFIISSVYFIHKGLTQHVLPLSILRWSQQKWNEGQYIESVDWFVAANESAFNTGGRWTIADFYLQRIRSLCVEGKLAEAQENCSRAVSILDGHDDEGTVNYMCLMIDQEMLKQK